MDSTHFDYYKRYSVDRYNLTQLTHGTSFIKKQYGFSGHEIEPNDSEVFSLIQGLMDYSLKIVRFDVLSRYQDHNFSPSTRNMHSAQVVFIIDKQYVFYDLYENKFISANQCSIEGISENKIYILGFSDLINISRYYGEFSFYLSNLDAGHVLGNLKNYLNQKGRKWIQGNSISPIQFFNEIDFFNQEMFGTFLISIERPNGDLLEGKRIEHKRITEGKVFSEISATDYLKHILIDINNQAFSSQKDRPQFNQLSFPYFKKRNSAHNMVGNFNLYDDTISDMDLVDLIKSLNTFRKNLSTTNHKYCFLRKDKIFHCNGDIESKSIDFKRVLYNDHEFFDLNTFDLMCIVYSNDCDVQVDGIIPSLLACGELMQAVALAFSKYDKSFRPMKNHNDLYLKSILNLNSNVEINYIGVECSNPVEQITRYSN